MHQRLATRAIAIVVALSAAAAASERLPNPWAELEPMIAQPVQTRPIKKWTKNGAELESFRFNSHQWKGKWIWAYAIYGKPKGKGPFPAVLHIHGGGQTASEANVLDWTRQGYACMSFDWTGPMPKRNRPPETTTPMPKGVANPRTDKPTIRYSKIWHAVVMSRRALTHMLARPEVDASRVGSYGISWGGYTMWLVNAMDHRLKAACAIYGCGIVAGRKGADKYIDHEWSAAFEPIHYATRQRAPILYLGATCDFFGWAPTYAAVSKKVTVDQRSAWAVNEDHHCAPAAATAYRWMDWRVRGGKPMPAAPALQLKAEAGKLVAHMAAPQAAKVGVIFSMGNASSPNRLWQRRPAQRMGGEWRAVLPVADANAQVWAMAEATYPEGYYLNSQPVFQVPAKLGRIETTRLPARIVYDPNIDGDTITRSTGTELYASRYDVRIAAGGPDGGKCVEVRSLVATDRGCRALLRHPADPARQGKPGEALAIWVAKNKDNRVALTAATARRGQAPFVVRLQLDPKGPEWQRLVVKREQFVRTGKDKTLQTLPAWNQIYTLGVHVANAPRNPSRFARIECTPAP